MMDVDKSPEQQHIEALFAARGRNDPNSTTLANTLAKDIETVFNSNETFILERLQNADDVGSDRNAIDVTFRM